MVWQRILPAVTVKGFEKCCIPDAEDGTNYALWNDSEEDGEVRSECEEDEGTDCGGRNSDSDL
jgi:hypothetical protein